MVEGAARAGEERLEGEEAGRAWRSSERALARRFELRGPVGALGLAALLGAGGATALWLAEELHWSGSLLAALRPYVGLLALLGGVAFVLARRARLAVAAGGLALWNLFPVIALYQPRRRPRVRGRAKSSSPS